MGLLKFLPRRPVRQQDMTSAAPDPRSDSSRQPLPLKSPPAGWLDSSAELRGGLQVHEDDLDTIPPEFRDAFSSR